MIGICPTTGRTLQSLEQLIARIDRMVRTEKGIRPKHRAAGTTIRQYLGKPNSRPVLTKLQNILLSDIANPANGCTDFSCSQVKVLPDGKIFIIGEYNGERVQFNF